MKTTAHFLVLAAVLTALFAPRVALSAEPSPPKVLEDAVHACAKAKVGDSCDVQISQRDNHGICVVFTQGALVCAIDAPP
jgi:hypothetical protein